MKHLKIVIRKIRPKIINTEIALSNMFNRFYSLFQHTHRCPRSGQNQWFWYKPRMEWDKHENEFRRDSILDGSWGNTTRAVLRKSGYLVIRSGPLGNVNLRDPLQRCSIISSHLGCWQQFPAITDSIYLSSWLQAIGATMLEYKTT